MTTLPGPRRVKRSRFAAAAAVQSGSQQQPASWRCFASSHGSAAPSGRRGNSRLSGASSAGSSITWKRPGAVCSEHRVTQGETCVVVISRDACFNKLSESNGSLPAVVPKTTVRAVLNAAHWPPRYCSTGIMAAQEQSPPSSLEGNKPGFPKKILANSLEDKHLCNSCQKVLRRPLQAQCGHRFCSFCFNKIVRWVVSLTGS